MSFFQKKNVTDLKPLKVVIVGCGKVGQTLVRSLSDEGNDVTIIDQNAALVDEIVNLYDVMGIAGNGASYAVQKEADIDNTDLFIAVTESDELNLLCCTVAKHANCTTIARVRKPDYIDESDFIKEKLGLQMIINPDLESAQEISQLFYLPSALEVNSFAHGQAELLKIIADKNSIMTGRSLKDLFHTDSHNGYESFLVVAVERQGKVIIPNGDFVINEGDRLSFMLPRRHKKEFLKQLDIKTAHLHNCMIVGGGITSYYLANMLTRMGIQVKIIESNKERCDELTSLLPDCIIINGDGTDENLLKEEGLEIADAFVSLTGIDEQNIFMTLHARKVSNAKVVTKITRDNFKDLIETMDLGSIIYPRTITSEAIIAYARAKRASIDYNNIETLYHMYGGKAEALEFNVTSKSAATDHALKDLNLKDGINVAFINRNGKILVPRGTDKILVGDTVMVVTTNFGYTTLDDILK